MLIGCVMITAVLSTALSSKISGGKNDRRLIASQAARHTTSLLRNLVTGCNCSITTGNCAVAGVGACSITGPMQGNCGGGATITTCTLSYSFNNPPLVDSRGTVYALASGTHTIQGLLPSEFEAAPYNARVIYYVTPTSQIINGRPVPLVNVTVDWTEI